MKTLVLYVFHAYNARVEYFIHRAIFKHDDIDFVIICNNRDIEFACPAYVEVLKRDNVGFDFGGWTDGLLVGDRYKAYDTFVFINSSVIGPFLPKGETRNWVDVFVSRLNERDRLVGPTLNTAGNPTYTIDPANGSHIQSYAFAVGREALEHLIAAGIFACPATFLDAVFQHEVRMSRVILDRGWNIACFLRCYAGVDFRNCERKQQWFGDVMFAAYKDRLWTLTDVMFIKGNRFGIK